MHPTKKHNKENSGDKPIKKEKPNWGISALYSDRQLIRNQKMTKFFVPFDSAKPDGSYFAFMFYGQSKDPQQFVLDQETYLIGREKFCDIQIIHPSVSRQHCALQFRRVRLEGEDPTAQLVPYIFDMSSYNGTFINDEKISSSRFVQLLPKDVITFGKAPDSLIIMQHIVEKEVNYDEDEGDGSENSDNNETNN